MMTLADKLFTDMEIKEHIYDKDESEEKEPEALDDRGTMNEEDE